MEKLIEMIRKGENEEIEFKEAVAKDIHKEVCALANSMGGHVLVGVDDDGAIVGVDAKKTKEEVTAQMLAIEPHIDVKIEEEKIDNKTVIILTVPKSKYICSVGNVVYVRVGTSKRPLSISEIFIKSVENLVTTIDKGLTNIKLAELDKESIDYFLNERARRGLAKRSYLDIFRKIGILVKRNGKETLSLAGAMFFTKNPQEHFPSTYVRIKAGEGEWKRIGGNIFSQVKNIMQEIENLLFKKSIVYKEKRIDIVQFPLDAIREAVVNAIIHRNYAIESEVFIKIEANEIIIENPGSFPPGVTPENPKPVPRNPLMYEIAFQSGLVEKEGEGIKRIIQLSKEKGLDVKYTTQENFLKLEISKPHELSDRKEKILALLAENEITSSRLSQTLKISKVTVLSDLKELVNRGLVDQIGVGKKTRYKMRKPT